jgi:3-phosphoshikimate 1-carboxyvinyltransferase
MKVESARRIRGVATTPGDKSISHRTLLISSLAEGTSEIMGLSGGEDVMRTSTIIQQLGAQVAGGSVVQVRGPKELTAAQDVLYCGNSGTTMRLLMGLVSGIPGTHRLDGDASLRSRPMDRVANPLSQMGAATFGEGNHITAPLRITSPAKLHPIKYEVPVPSAQVKSALLLAALHAEGISTISEGRRTRTNTEDMLAFAGVQLDTIDTGEARIISLHPSRPQVRKWRVPQDPSQAAFFLVAGIIHPDAEISVEGVYGGRERTGFLSVLQRMGADLVVATTDDTFSAVARSSSLLGTEIPSSEIPSVDEVPILVVAAAAASGTTTFTAMSELRVKESDRFAGSVNLARSLGAKVEVSNDSFAVTGVGTSERFSSAKGGHPGDHRMTMATAIAGWCGNGAEIEYPESVSSSFPDFFQLLTSLSE